MIACDNVSRSRRFPYRLPNALRIPTPPSVTIKTRPQLIFMRKTRQGGIGISGMEVSGAVDVAKPAEWRVLWEEGRRKLCVGKALDLADREKKLVCVTSGNSKLGSQLVKELLAHGYPVRVTIQNQMDIEYMRERMEEEEMNKLESVVVAKMEDLHSLCGAFRGCHAIFHTSSFIDPLGASGYLERMALLETQGARNVVEACSRAATRKRCIFTSSLLASIWRGDDMDGVVDERSWSDEDFCRENKLWLALGKTAAEKAAWMKSQEMKVRLVTVCPGLLMVPFSPHVHMETALPYLKGGHTMLRRGLLAVVEEKKVAEAHVHVYEAMDYGATGRYLCFDRVLRSFDEVVQFENGLKMHGILSGGRREESATDDEHVQRSNLSNSKLVRLVFQASQQFSCRLEGLSFMGGTDLWN